MVTREFGSGIGVLRLAFAKPGERSLSMTPKIAWILPYSSSMVTLSLV